MKYCSFKFFEIIKMFFRSFLVLAIAISVTAERSNSSLPSQLTGKTTDIKHFVKSLLRVVKIRKNERGEYSNIVISGATAITRTLAVAPIRPHFAKYHNDDQGRKIITEYDDLKVWFGFSPDNIDVPTAVCEVEDIILESDYRIDNVEPKLAIIIFKCSSKRIRIRKVIFPDANENQGRPSRPMANQRAELLGWNMDGGHGLFRNRPFNIDGADSYMWITNENQVISDLYRGGFLLNRGKLFAIVVRQHTIECNHNEFFTYINLANIFPRIGFIKKNWNRQPEQQQLDRNRGGSASSSMGRF